jgi:hypothetical protein
MFTDEERRRGGLNGGQKTRERTAAFAEQFRPLIEHYIARGASHRQISETLNANGIKSYRGGQWHRTQVQRLVTRLKLSGSGKR